MYDIWLLIAKKKEKVGRLACKTSETLIIKVEPKLLKPIYHQRSIDITIEERPLKDERRPIWFQYVSLFLNFNRWLIVYNNPPCFSDWLIDQIMLQSLEHLLLPAVSLPSSLVALTISVSLIRFYFPSSSFYYYYYFLIICYASLGILPPVTLHY